MAVKTNTRTSYPDLTFVAPSKNLDLVKRNTTFPAAIGSNSSSSGDLGTGSSGRSGRASFGANGRLSTSDPNQLVSIGDGHYLNPYVAQQYLKMKSDFERDTGLSFNISESYRSYSEQVRLYQKLGPYNPAKGGGAAKPGTSNHGLGLALDIRVSNSPQTLNWLRNNAGKYGFNNIAGENWHWEIKPNKIPPDFTPKRTEFPKPTTPSPGSTQPPKPTSPGNLDKQLEVAINYQKTKTSPDPINSQVDFFNTLNTDLTDYPNDFGFFWYKQYAGIPEEIKSQVNAEYSSDQISYGDDFFFSAPSDSVGTLTNTSFNESISPIFDITNNYGAPEVAPIAIDNKLPPELSFALENFSSDTSQLFKQNTINLQKISDETNLAQSTIDSHSLNFILDQHYYNKNIAAQPEYTKELTSTYENTADYISFFNNWNDNRGYNPRDTENKNLQRIDDIYYEMNVEGKIVLVDLLQKKYKHSMSSRTIGDFLCVKDCFNQSTSPTTGQINDIFKYQERTYNIKSIPISFTESAQSKIDSALDAVKAPNALLADLQTQVDKVGIPGIPGLQELAAPLTSPIGNLAQTINSIPLLVSAPLNNLPNTLPSVDPGSFPEIYALMSNTSFKDLNNPQSVFQAAQDLKNIACDFKLPVIGKVDWDNIISGDFDDSLKSLEEKIKSLIPKEFKKDGFVNLIKDLKTNFQNVFKDLYKSLFECENTKDS